MIVGLVLILFLTLFLPLLSNKIEQNLEVFLFIVGISAATLSGVLSYNFLLGIFENKFMYLISAAVLIGGILFKALNSKMRFFLEKILQHLPISLFVFLMIIVLGLISSIITAIIAALLLVEIVSLLNLKRKNKIAINIIACFSIGLGSSLTPIGEPLSTIVVSKLKVDFLYIFNLIGVYVIPIIVLLGLLGAWYTKDNKNTKGLVNNIKIEEESYRAIIIRTVKIFIFVIALEMLGAGFKPIIDMYIIKLNTQYLYLINITSAVLDNATIASAEISAIMTATQIKALLLSLLISGGMMIPGNIPNIISANKLKIKSSEWIKLGFPLGLSIYLGIFIIMFML